MVKLLGIIGLILGLVGLNEIKRLGHSARGMAIAGTKCSGIGLLLIIFIMTISVAVF